MASVIVDANLLVLLLVGITDRAFISKHKKTRSFTEEDFDLLTIFLSQYQSIVVTPNILTETSNLAGLIGEPNRSFIFETLKVLLKAYQEIYLPSSTISDNLHFTSLGITDCGIIETLSKEENTELITTDLDLYLAAASSGKRVYNFNHLRAAYL